MRHRKMGRRFDMPTSQRMAMFRNIATAVLANGSVETTEARAKEARRFVDRMVTLGKRGTLHDRPFERRRCGCGVCALFRRGFSKRGHRQTVDT